MDTKNKKSGWPGGTAQLAGRQVARIGFGAMQLPGPGVWGPPRDRSKALAVLRRAIELGANHLDTAQFYGPDIANELIYTALYPYPENLVIVSKVGAERNNTGEWVPAQRPEQLRAGVEANLRSLKIDQIAVVNLRLMDDHHGSTPAASQLAVGLDDQLAEMVALREEGKIGGIGLSNTTADQLHKALPAGLACVQNAYNLLDRSAEPLLDLCLAHEIAWVPFFPLGSAFSGRVKVSEHALVMKKAAELGITPAQVGLSWLLAHAPHILLIAGTANPDHLAENMAAGDIELDRETMEALDRVGT